MAVNWNDLPPELVHKIATDGQVACEIRGVCRSWKAALETPCTKIYIRGSDLPMNLAPRYPALKSLDLLWATDVTPQALHSLPGLPELRSLNLIPNVDRQDLANPAFSNALRGLALTSLDLNSGETFVHPEDDAAFADIFRGLPLVRFSIWPAGGALSDSFLSLIGGMPLTQLHMGDENCFTDDGLKVIRGMHLTDLNLGAENSFSDAGMEVLRGMPLRHLSLGDSWHSLGDDTLKLLGEMSSLVSLKLGGAPSILTDVGIAALHGMSLTSLDFSECDEGSGITDACLTALRGMPLQRLKLFGGVTDVGMGHLRGLPLTELWCFGDGITDGGLEFLREMRLTRLVCSYTNSITNAGLLFLRGMPLTKLSLLHISSITTRGLWF